MLYFNFPSILHFVCVVYVKQPLTIQTIQIFLKMRASVVAVPAAAVPVAPQYPSEMFLSFFILFVRSFVSLFTYRLFFLSSRNRSSYSTKLYNRKILTFKKNKWHTKFAAENNFCEVIRALFHCKHLNNKHIALVIFNGSKLNANRKKNEIWKREWAFFRHHHITILMIWLWIFFVFICCSLASWPLTELTLIEWEIKSRVSISSPSILFVFYCVGLKKKSELS